MHEPLQPEQLLPILQRLPRARRYWIAFSGGMDSTVLLHSLASLAAKLPVPLSAIHVDHGLSANSSAWSQQCRRQCEALGVELVVRQVKVAPHGKGVEAAAREARYEAFSGLLGEGEILLTAHHQDDQAETLLLQLLRGGGVRGLAAMPEARQLGAGWLGRPLLGFSRSALQQYAATNGLTWVDDPSNFDTALQRNYLRHELIPALEQRHQSIKAVLARSADHFAEAAELLDEIASLDLAAAADTGQLNLSITVLQGLTAARQRNLLRYWLRSLGLPVPDSTNLERILGEVVTAQVGAEPIVAWQGGEVRRYRDYLYAMRPLASLPEQMPAPTWQGDVVMDVPAVGTLSLSRVKGRGLREELLGHELTVSWRQGGEQIAPPGRAGHHSLKKLYQEAGIPPWDRERRPLVYIDGQLAQVAGLWTDRRFACRENGQGIQFEWSYAIEKAGENDDN